MIDARFQPMNKPFATEPYKRSPFGGSSMRNGNDMEREFRFLEARDIVIESGHDRTQIRNDGWPRSATRPKFPDIRIYFESNKGPLKYECAAFSDFDSNIRAIVLWMQRQRLAIEEWGIGRGGEAYRGFAALPTKPGEGMDEWFKTKEDAARFIINTAIAPKCASGFDVETAIRNPAVIQAWFKDAAKKAHPDAGGSEELMRRVNAARDFIARETT